MECSFPLELLFDVSKLCALGLVLDRGSLRRCRRRRPQAMAQDRVAAGAAAAAADGEHSAKGDQNSEAEANARGYPEPEVIDALRPSVWFVLVPSSPAAQRDHGDGWALFHSRNDGEIFGMVIVMVGAGW